MRASPAIRQFQRNRSIIASTEASTGPISAGGRTAPIAARRLSDEVDQVVHRDLPPAIHRRDGLGEDARRLGVVGGHRVDDPVEQDGSVAQEPTQAQLVVALADGGVAIDRDLEGARGESIARAR